MGQEINFRRQRGGKKRKVKKKKNHLKFEDNKKKLKFEKKKNPRLIRQIIIWAAEIAGACAVAVLLVAFLGHRISNSGDAMTPSIRNGEVVLVDRLVIDMKELSRGQIVAFRPNGNKEVHFYIRRVAGLPGETVQIKEGKLYIDGEELKSYEYVSEIRDAGIAAEPVKLGADEYFLLGDNPQGGEDSRSSDIGIVKKDDLYGKVWFNTTSGDHFGIVKK